MIPIDKAVSVKYVKGKKHFEILVDPDLAQRFKKGEKVDISEVLAVETIFEDVKRALRASKKELQETFETGDVLEVAAIIIKEGKIHTTQEQRSNQNNETWKKIVATISISAVDAKTGIPIPQKTIEEALQKAMFRVDTRKVEDQMSDAIKAVKKIIPLGFKEKTIQINNLDMRTASVCLELCKRYGSIERQTKDSNGAVTAVVKVPAGLREDLMDRLNALTKGNIDVRLLD